MADIEEIKLKLDIVEVIRSYLPNLTRAGANFKDRCPFHSEKSASFMVNPTLQIFKCFGCGKGGDVIGFIKEIERVEFKEALAIAAEKAGIEINNTFDAGRKQERARIIEANTLAAKFYNYILSTHKSGKSGRDYAQKRQIDAKQIAKFLIGYATNNNYNLKKFLIKKGFTEKELFFWGLLVERNGKFIDKFRDRLMQPIFSPRGEIIGFSGRYIGNISAAPKYLNSPETIVYKKNQNLYGLFQAKESMRKNKFVILEEGNIDILSSHRVGIENIVAPLGTAFTENQAILLKKYVDAVYICFDTDTAGISALIRGIAILENAEILYKVLDIGKYQDPDDLICHEPERWKEVVNSPVDAVEFLIKKFSSEYDLSLPDGKNNFALKILPVLRSIKNPITLSHYIKEVSVLLEVESRVIELQMEAKKEFAGAQKEKQETEKKDFTEAGNVTDLNSNESNFLALIIQHKDIDIAEFLPEVLESPAASLILSTIKTQTERENLEGILATLPEEIKDIFKDLLLKDLTNIKDYAETAKKLYLRLYENYLRIGILKLRKNTSFEDESLTLELSKKMIELKKLISRKPPFN